MPLRRLPHSAETREKLSIAATGRRHTDITRLKIGVARLGKKHSPETIEKIRAARRARDVPTTRKDRLKARDRECKARVQQWRQDMVIAHHLGDKALWRDIRRSRGWWGRRSKHHPLVSDGWSRREHKAVWGRPRGLAARRRLGLIKNYVGSGIPHKRQNGTR